MKRMVCSIAVPGILMAALVACSQPAPYTPTPPPATVKATGLVKSQWDSLVEAARKEGSVVVYVTQIGGARDVATKTFRERYGVDIDWVVGDRGVELANKLRAQTNAGLYLADAMLVGLTTYFASIKPMKITVPLEPLLVLPEVTDGSKWRTGRVPFVGDPNIIAIASHISPFIAINTEMVKEGEITSMEDILAPKWKGKILLNDPSVTGSGTSWFNWVISESEAYGKEKGLEYMRKLARQEPVITRNMRLQVEWIARGKYPVGIGTSPNEVDIMAGKGAPIKAIGMKEGGPVTTGSLDLIAFDKPPHPNAAKLFSNWVLGQEAGIIWSKHTSGYVSERADVPTEGIDPILIPGPKDKIPGEETILQQTENLRLAAEVFKDLLK